ncbi:putative ribonuclease H-like domain-containing protein [Tanacetum coccineum]
MTSPYPTPPFTVPSPSESSFSIPTTSEPVFSVATTEPVFESQTSHSAQPSQNTQPQFQQYNSTTVSSKITLADFHHLDDAKDIWLAVKARFGGNEESKKMRKSMLKQEFADFKISESEGLPRDMIGFRSFDDLYNKLRTLEIDVKVVLAMIQEFLLLLHTQLSLVLLALIPSGQLLIPNVNPSSVSYTNKLSSLLILQAMFLKMFFTLLLLKVIHNNRSLMKTLTKLASWIWKNLTSNGRWQCFLFESIDLKKKAGRKFKFNNKDAARFDKKKVRCYQCSELGHFARECTGKKVDSKTRYSQFKIKELDKSEEPKALVSVDSMLNWSDHESEDMEKGASEVYGMIAGYGDDAVIPAVDAADGVSTDGIFADGVFVATGNGSDGVSVAAGVGADGVSVTSSDATDAETQFALMGLSPQVQSCPFGCNYIYTELKKDFDNLEVQYKECFIQVQAYKSSLQNLEQQKSWYQNNQLALEEKIRILTADLGNTTNMLKYTEKLNEQAKIDNMNNKVKLEESEARFDKWMESSKNLVKLINSSMSSRSKFGLGFGDTFGSDEVFDLSAPSIFDSCLKDAIEKPLYDWFVKPVGMHAVPPPITGTFMPPSNKPDIDDTQFTYGSKS